MKAMCLSSSVMDSVVCVNRVRHSHNHSILLLVHRVPKFDVRTWIKAEMKGKYSSKIHSLRSNREQRRMSVMSESL